MATTTDIQNEIIENFSLFDGDMESTLFYLMDLGKKLPQMPDDHKIETFIVKGCQSKVWVFPTFVDGKVNFEADSNTEITKGLVYLLWSIWNKQTPDEILNTELFFIDKIGMSRMIGSQRSNGFVSMIKQMKLYALAYKNS
ncbi:MAG: SufE family protein [Bacteroidia bacterium]|nr:SufE family protein [Bacteroidia bacterium]MBP9690327.1 SufE family protein [Bacteroidia bacterium]